MEIKTCPEHQTKLNRAGKCKNCQERESNRRYQDKHKQELKDKRRVYLEKNHDHILEYQRNYTKAHKKEKLCSCGNPRGFRKILCDECRVNNRQAKSKKYYWKNWEKMQEKNRKYRELKKIAKRNINKPIINKVLTVLNASKTVTK